MGRGLSLDDAYLVLLQMQRSNRTRQRGVPIRAMGWLHGFKEKATNWFHTCVVSIAVCAPSLQMQGSKRTHQMGGSHRGNGKGVQGVEAHTCTVWLKEESPHESRTSVSDSFPSGQWGGYAWFKLIASNLLSASTQESHTWHVSKSEYPIGAMGKV